MAAPPSPASPRPPRRSASPSCSPGILPGATSLVAAIGQVVIDLQPPGAKDFVVVALRDQRQARPRAPHRRRRARDRRRPRASWRDAASVAAVDLRGFGVVGFLASLDDPLANPGHRGDLGRDLGRRRPVGPRLAARAGRGAARRAVRRRRRRPERVHARLVAPLVPDPGRRAWRVAAVVAGFVGRTCSSASGSPRRAPAGHPAGVGDASRRSDPTQDLSTTDPGADPDRHAERPLLPDRHRAARRRRRHGRPGRCGSTGSSTARRR